MDILFELSDLLFQDVSDLPHKGPEYRELVRIEGNLCEKISAKAGEELVDKLLDAQHERAQQDRLICFLHGLRLGVELLRLQGG